MKLLTEKNEVHSQGIIASTQYRVANNSHLMNLLSKSLYSDPIKATIRELSTNAKDAHLMADNDVAFDVHLPTEKDCNFRIRDFGISLSKEQMERLYTVYGLSNKQHTNDLNGMFGIGSKVAYCYTTMFTCTSHLDGMKYIYVNVKDEHNVPCLQFISETPTDQPNGLEISFPVKREDIYSFREKAEEVYQYFDVKPNIIGSDRLNYDKEKVVLEGKNKDWRIFEGHGCNSKVVFGWIAYDIDSEHFHSTSSNKWRNDNEFIALLNCGLEITLPIGLVDIAASREELSYTPNTIAFLKTRLTTIREEINELITSRFVSCKNLWEARCLYSELCVGSLQNIKGLLTYLSPTWQNHPLTQTILITYPDGLAITYFYAVASYRRHGNARPKQLHNPSHVNAGAQTKIYRKDTNTNYVSQINREIEGGKVSCAYLVECDDTTFEDFLEALGMDESYVTRTSTFPKPKRVKGQVSSVNYCKTFKLNSTFSGYANKDNWERVKVDFNQGGVYVEISNYLGVRKDKQSTPPKLLKEILNKLTTLGLTSPVVYGIKTASIKKFQDSKKWVELDDFVKSELKKWISANNFDELYSKYKAYDEYHYNIEKYNAFDLNDFGLTSEFREFLEFITDLTTYGKTKKATITTAHELATFVSMSAVGMKIRSVDEYEKEIFKKYPMLKIIEWHNITYKKESKAVTDYILLVDGQ